MRNLQHAFKGREKSQEIPIQTVALAYRMVPGLESLSKRIGSKENLNYTV
jgi:hypothetical protein